MIKQILICLLFLNLEKVSAVPLSYLGAGSPNISVRTNGINNWTIDAPAGWSIVAGTNVVLVTNIATKTITVSSTSSGGGGDSFWVTNVNAANSISNLYGGRTYINGNSYNQTNSTDTLSINTDFECSGSALFSVGTVRFLNEIDATSQNVKLSTINSVKRYVALLTQTGTDAPVATVLENTFGGTLVWAYNGSSGSYVVTLTGAFPLAKTLARISATGSGLSTYPSSAKISNEGMPDSIYVQIDEGNDVLNYTPIEILGYP